LALPEDIRACVTLDGPREPEPSRSYVISVDVGLKHDRTVVCVAHTEGEPRTVVLDRMAVWVPRRDAPVKLADVEAYLREAATRHRPARIVFDPWQAVGLAQRLRAEGFIVEEFTFSASSVGGSGARFTGRSAITCSRFLQTPS
jgi:hypothetical protein